MLYSSIVLQSMYINLTEACSAIGIVSVSFFSIFSQDILRHIHSLVPLRDAARAACVSHRFRRSWRCFPNLTFDLEELGLNKDQDVQYEERANKFMDRVHNILQNHSGIGVKTLKLNLCPCRTFITAYYVETSSRSCIATILNYA